MNQVKLQGIVSNKKSGTSQGGTAWANAMVEVSHEGRNTKVIVSAFDGAAAGLAAADNGEVIQITGHLAKKKPREEGGTWETVVIADKAYVVGTDDDIPF